MEVPYALRNMIENKSVKELRSQERDLYKHNTLNHTHIIKTDLKIYLIQCLDFYNYGK